LARKWQAKRLPRNESREKLWGTNVRVLGEDGVLMDWFLGLENLSDNARDVEIANLIARRKTGKEDAELIKALTLLRNARL
jgi:hypothetical protein